MPFTSLRGCSVAADSKGRAVFRAIVGVGALAALGAVLWFATRPPPLVVQGEVSANRVDISSRVPGRIAKLTVDVGDSVKQGDVIATLESPQLDTGLLAARAALNVAKADFERVNSTRQETIDARRADLAAAKADVVLYREISDRQAALIRSGNTPQQRVDEATRNLEAATRKQEAAEAQVRLVEKGASDEEKALSAAQVKQAEASLSQREADVTELTIKAPISGQVTTKVAELGENFSAGAPIYSLIDLNDQWFTFNLREDLLAGLKVGDQFDVTIPALGSKTLSVRVTTINVQGQFATWRATRATGDFDLRTFEVRAKPVDPIEGLRPGMSVIAAWNRQGN